MIRKSVALLLSVCLIFGCVPLFGAANAYDSYNRFYWNNTSEKILADMTYVFSDLFDYSYDISAIAAEETAASSEPVAGDLTALAAKIAEKGLDATDMRTLLASALASVGIDTRKTTLDAVLRLPGQTMDAIVTYIFAGLKALGVEVDPVYEKLASNKILRWFIERYGPEVILTCVPADAVEIDNIAQTVTVKPITEETIPVTFTLTPNNSCTCDPISFDATVIRSVELESVQWTYNCSPTGIVDFTFYEYGVIPQTHSTYYYAPTTANDCAYKFTTVPAEACELPIFRVTSSDERVIKVDKATRQLIVIGNGQTTLTITATAKNAAGETVTKSHSFDAVVQDSPYTPITGVSLGFDPENVSDDVTYDSGTNTLQLKPDNHIGLVVNAQPNNADVNRDRVGIDVPGVLLCVPESSCTWSTSDPTVATVDVNGVVTAVGKGRAVISVTVDDYGYVMHVSVNIQVENYTFRDFIRAILDSELIKAIRILISIIRNAI